MADLRDGFAPEEELSHLTPSARPADRRTPARPDPDPVTPHHIGQPLQAPAPPERASADAPGEEPLPGDTPPGPETPESQTNSSSSSSRPDRAGEHRLPAHQLPRRRPAAQAQAGRELRGGLKKQLARRGVMLGLAAVGAEGVVVLLVVLVLFAAALSFTQSGSAGTGGGDITAYKNPLRDISPLGPARIDEGVDYTGDGPIYALGDGQISFYSSDTGWPSVTDPNSGGSVVSYKLSAGPAAGKTVYVAENCTLNPSLSVGSQVTSDTVVCQMHNVWPFIETGWAQEGTDVPMASDLYRTVPDGSAMAFGVNFSDLLKALGAPAGTYQFPSQQGHPVGDLPTGWPTW